MVRRFDVVAGLDLTKSFEARSASPYRVVDATVDDRSLLEAGRADGIRRHRFGLSERGRGTQAARKGDCTPE
jgi:hypothetical protein